MASEPSNESDFCCSACRRRFLLPIANGKCEQCKVLASINARPGSHEFREIQNWPQCQSCSASSEYLHLTAQNGSSMCGDCADSSTNEETSGGWSVPQDSQTPVSSIPASEESAVAAAARARRNEATAVRLRKATPNLSATLGSRQPHRTTQSASSSASHLNTQTPNRFKHGHGQPGEAQITMILSFKLSTKPGKLDGRFGNVIRHFAISKLIPDVVADILTNQFNQTWVRLYGASLNPQTETSLRLSGNHLLDDGTANLSLGAFHRYYENHPSGACSVDKAKAQFKLSFNKKVIVLELLAEVELFTQRTEADEVGGTIRAPTATARSQRKRSRTPSGSTQLPLSRSTEIPRTTASRALRSDTKVSTSRQSGAMVGNTVHFKRVVPETSLLPGGRIVSCTLIVDNEGGEEDFVQGVIRTKEELSRGTMKQVFEATYNGIPYVAKRYFRITASRTRQNVSYEENRSALRAELKRYGIAARWLQAFLQTAKENLVEVDKRIEVTNAFVAEEQDGKTWLFEPRITSSDPIKFCGTLQHKIPATSLTAKTVHTFIHFVERRSEGTLVFADVQGSAGRLTTGQDGIILFDYMTHTPIGKSGPGDHGMVGIKAYRSGHKCNAICDAFEANSLFDAPEYSASDDERPKKKLRVASQAHSGQIRAPRSKSSARTSQNAEIGDSDVEEILEMGKKNGLGAIDASLERSVVRHAPPPASDPDGAPLSDEL